MSEYFDIHTHILPHADDGSSSSSESISMLCALYDEGVKRVVATPHFYATSDEPEAFLKRRHAAMTRLTDKISKAAETDHALLDRLPSIYLGGEIEFFSAMSNAEILKELCISGTSFLLVEMPFDTWTQSMAEELYMLAKKQGITPIIAHVDRYFKFFKNKMLDEMINNGIKVQINADAFLRFGTRRRALDLVKSGRVHFLGSDTHNMGKRAPRFGEATVEIEKRLGSSTLRSIVEESNRLLKNAVPVFKAGDNADE